jgi:acyl-CoA synthetase (AMP-forming)/AMP-acid ligase II
MNHSDKIARRWTSPSTSPWAPPDFSEFTYPRLLSLQAKTRPDSLAVVTPTCSLAWKQLDDEAARCGASLLALGTTPTDKVSILLANCCEWVSWAHGATGVGGVLVPANTRFRQDELAYQLKASDTRVLVMQRGLDENNFLGMIGNLVPELRTGKPGEWRSTAFPKLRHIICLDASPGEIPGIMTSADAARLATPQLIAAVRRARESIEPQNPAIIQYTSGTTASPKGAVITHYGTTRNAFHMNERLHIDAADRIYVPGPFFHVAGTTLGILLGLLSGAPIYTQSKFDPPSVLAAIKKEQITVYSGVDSLFITLFKHSDFNPTAVASIKKGWIASSPDIVRMVHRDMGLTGITNVFGISEASPNVTICDIDDPMELRAQTCGYPHPDCEVKIIDPETQSELPPDERGEICFRGYSLMLGYYKNPVETAKAIDLDGWLHTGDRGLLRPTGELEYHGRIKEMLRVGGENLAPAEVEEVLCQHPKVRQAAVVGIPDDRLIEVPAAVLELKPGEQCTVDEIVEFCKPRLAAYKVPRRVAFIDSMPMTGSGKIQKFRLSQDLFNGKAGLQRSDGRRSVR